MSASTCSRSSELSTETSGPLRSAWTAVALAPEQLPLEQVLVVPTPRLHEAGDDLMLVSRLPSTPPT